MATRDESDDARVAKKEAPRTNGQPAPTGSTPRLDERPPSEVRAEVDLLKSSGGDPFTQESD